MSDLLNQASLVYVPSGYKEDTAYSVIPTDGSGDLTFTRASDGTRVNSAGLVEVVPFNLLEQSNTFNTTWVGSNATVTSGQSGYDGTNNAWLLASTTDGGRIVQSLNEEGLQTFSVFAKAGSFSWGRLVITASTGNQDRWFDLSNGTQGATNYNPLDSTITSVGNGWYRITLTYNESLTGCRIYPANANGDVTGLGNIYIQDAQLNTGSTAKPYFPTTDRLNVPRLTYEGGCPSLLLEPQRTNLVTYSEQFDNGAWTKNDGTITANATTSPDGTQNADLFTESTGTIIPSIRQNLGASTTTSVTLSVFAKSNGRNYLYLALTGSDAIIFNISDGTVGVTLGTIDSYSIENMGDGWFRCSASKSTNQRDANFGPKATNAFGTYSGDGTSGIYIWGAQLEEGSYPTSYIPTTSASVTRVEDEASKTGIGSLIGQSEGTIFADVNLTHSSSSNDYILQIFQDSSNRILLYRSSGNVVGCYLLKAGGSIYDTTTASAFTGRTKLAFAYKSGDIAFYVNGSQIGTSSATFTAFSSLSALNIDSNNSNENGHFSYNQAALFKTRLTNTELAALTTL